MARVTVHERRCRSIVARSRIPGVDWAINPYVGCQHDCAYCYARFMSKYTSHHLPWGRFVDVKIGASELLRDRALADLAHRRVVLSTVTDPYQPVERRYRITREILARLIRSEASVSVLTKSDLVLRDLDLLAEFPRSRLEIGMSAMSLDEVVNRRFEPGAVSVERRLQALRRLREGGIRTWLFLAPLIPGLSERTVMTLLERAAGAIDFLMVDTLNIKGGGWPAIHQVLATYYPTVLASWSANRRRQPALLREIRDRCRDLRLGHTICGEGGSGGDRIERSPATSYDRQLSLWGDSQSS